MEVEFPWPGAQCEGVPVTDAIDRCTQATILHTPGVEYLDLD
jgi:hypothetical protein